MVERHVRRSPLAEYQEALAALPVELRELPFLTQLSLRLDPDSSVAAKEVAKVLGGPLPTVPCTVTELGDVTALWLGPDEWLLLAEPAQREELANEVRTAIGDAAGALIDVSAQRTALALRGPRAGDVLARGCSIDLHPTVTPTGSCVQTLLAQAGVVLVVRDDAASDFLILVRATFAAYVADWLIDACTELP